MAARTFLVLLALALVALSAQASVTLTSMKYTATCARSYVSVDAVMAQAHFVRRWSSSSSSFLLASTMIEYFEAPIT